MYWPIKLKQMLFFHVTAIQIGFFVKDAGAHLERRGAGIRRVRVHGKDFTNHRWGYQVISSPFSYKMLLLFSFLWRIWKWQEKIQQSPHHWMSISYHKFVNCPLFFFNHQFQYKDFPFWGGWLTVKTRDLSALVKRAF